MANTHSHLTLSDRIYIEQALERRMKFKDIAVFIGKDPTTISKEIRRHRVAKESGRKTALCENRSTCTKQHVCRQSYCNKLCGKCTLHYCYSYCEDYSASMCSRLISPPYVCNGCGIRSCRQDTKYYYRAQIAEQDYREVLSGTRRGINKTALELDDLDRLISPLLKQGQPLNHILQHMKMRSTVPGAPSTTIWSRALFRQGQSTCLARSGINQEKRENISKNLSQAIA